MINFFYKLNPYLVVLTTKKAFIPIKGRRLYFAVPPKFINK